MGDIFKQAERVIVWLGGEDQQSGSVMRIIGDSWRFAVALQEYKDFIRFGPYVSNDERFETQDYLRSLRNAGLALEAFLKRSYWDRLWVVQEFVLARKMLLACGSCAVSFSAITTFRDAVSKWPRNVTGFSDSVAGICGVLLPAFPEQVTTLLDARSERGERVTLLHPDMHLLLLLRDFSGRSCENPSDKIYGLLALCGGAMSINVDYSKPSKDLYQEVFSSIGHFDDYEQRQDWSLKLAKAMGWSRGMVDQRKHADDD